MCVCVGVGGGRGRGVHCSKRREFAPIAKLSLQNFGETFLRYIQEDS